jgi:hypothetical protein
MVSPEFHALALYFAFNFVRVHKMLRIPPAMAAGIMDRLWSMEDIIARSTPTRLPLSRTGLTRSA